MIGIGFGGLSHYNHRGTEVSSSACVSASAIGVLRALNPIPPPPPMWGSGLNLLGRVFDHPEPSAPLSILTLALPLVSKHPRYRL